MDNYNVPSDPPPPETGPAPVSPAVTSLPETDIDDLDNPPPPHEGVEDAPNPPSQPAAEDALPVEGPLRASSLEEVASKVREKVAAYPMLSVLVAGIAGFGLVTLLNRAPRLRPLRL